MTRTYSCRFLRPGQCVAHLRGDSGWTKRGQRTRRSMGLLVELGLVRFQHADLAPAIEEERYGRHPDHQDEDHEQHLFDTDYHHWSV
jgi:hypothetical protein